MKTVLARPGSLYVGKVDDHDAVVIADASAGWMVPKGIRHWEDEVTIIARDDVTDAVRAQVKATFPEEQIPPAKLPLAFHAASSSPFVAVSRKLVPELVALGIRTHTIGADRASSGFFYFAEGGSEEPIRIQGELLTLIGPTLTGDETTALIDQHLESVIDRLLVHLSKGALSEVAVELAAALPRLNADGTGLEGVDLDAFEREAEKMVAAGKGWEKEARQVSETLQASEGPSAPIALFGVAKREPQFELTADLDGRKVTLPRRPRWIVRGEPSRTIPIGTSPSALPPAVAPAPQPVAKAPEARPAPVAAAQQPAPATPRAARMDAAPQNKAPASARNVVAAPPPSAPKLGTAAAKATEASSPKAPPVQAAQKARIDPPTPLKPMPITMLNAIREEATREATPKAQPVVEKTPAQPVAAAPAPAPVQPVVAAPAPAPAPAQPVAAAPAPAPAAPQGGAGTAAAAPSTREVAAAAAAVPAAPASKPQVAAAATPVPAKAERQEAAAKPQDKPVVKAATTPAKAAEAPSGGAGKIAIAFVLVLVLAVAVYLFMKH